MTISAHAKLAVVGGLLAAFMFGCREKDNSTERRDSGPPTVIQDAAADTGNTPTDPPVVAHDGGTEVPPKPVGKPNGSTCALPTECASGFCADHLCCNTACDAQCYACDQASHEGTCTPLNGEDDLSAVVSCAGVNTCAADPSGGAACKLRDGESCNSDVECASAHCRTYFVDMDADGYGISSRSINRCDGVPRPPAGYAPVAGDCCDSDSGAHPGVTAFFVKADACGSFDWNCSGAEDKHNGGWCPSQGAPSASIISCGSICCYGASGYTSCASTAQACN